MSKKTYSFIDLFAGCGGLTEGFLQTGRFKALAHVEWEKPMVDTLRNRLCERWKYTKEDSINRVVLFDIQKTEELINGNWSENSVEEYGNSNGKIIMQKGLRGIIKNQHINLIIGGPPCQAYSIHGRATDKKSMQDDYRNYLFESFCKVVAEFQPDAFVFENVKGLLSAKPGGISVRERIYEAFTKIGYEIRNPQDMPSTLFDASDFNVPQIRPRVIIVGIKKKSCLSLDELYESISNQKSNKPKVTVRDAIGGLPPLYPLNKSVKVGRVTKSHTDNTDASITQHDARNVSEKMRKVFRDWIENQMNNITHKEMIDYYYQITGHKTLFQKYKSLEWQKPSHTVVAHLQKDGYMFIHPDAEQERSITVREAACLQSFPIDFQFLGSTPYNFKMIGNAVPVLFAKAIATGIYKILDKQQI